MKIVFSFEKTYNMEKTTVITTRQELFILEDSLYQHTSITDYQKNIYIFSKIRERVQVRAMTINRANRFNKLFTAQDTVSP